MLRFSSSLENKILTRMMNQIIIKNLGLQRYVPVYQQMQAFNAGRNPQTTDELWCLQHESVFTLGMAGKQEHILSAGQVPVVQTDRGGQVTYHGPGQLVIYTLLDLRRKNMTIKRFVRLLEQSVIDFLQGYGIDAGRRAGAPGVYVAGGKIAALGVRVRGGCCYHGIAINVDMDLTPFSQINPCGYPNLAVTQLYDLAVRDKFAIVQQRYQESLLSALGYVPGLYTDSAGWPSLPGNREYSTPGDSSEGETRRLEQCNSN